MQRITHTDHFKHIPDEILEFIIKRFQQLAEETDTPPIIILVKPEDDIAGADYSFIGSNGLLSDYFDENDVHHPNYTRPYEWVSHHDDLKIYELLLLLNGEDGYWILIPDDIVEKHPDLKWVLSAEELGGLSPAQLF